MAATEPGTVLFDRYRVVRRIAAGGMGTVFEARDVVLDQPVALKRVSYAALPDELAAETRERTLREARNAAQMRGNPDVVAIYDVQVSDDDVWLVLEYLPSRSLAELTAGRTKLDVRTVAGIGATVARGLAAAHARGITHRDVKPGNILIATDGASTTKLTDFGISHAEGESTLTATGQVSGTPAYMAREVARGEDATPASDVFSLGATLYAAVEGVGPFGSNSNPRAMVYRVANDPVRPPEVAGPLTPALMAMMADEPVRRPSAAAAADWLDSLAAQADGGRGTSAGQAGRAPGVFAPGSRSPGPQSPGSQSPGSQSPGPQSPRPGSPVAVGQGGPQAGRPVQRSYGGHPRPAAAAAAVGPGRPTAVEPERSPDGGAAAPAAPRSRRTAVVAGAVVVVLIAVVAVFGVRAFSASDEPAPTAASPRAISGDPRTADPCPLLDLAALQRFGTVTSSAGAAPSGCRANVTGSDGRPAEITAQFNQRIAVDGGYQQVGDLTVQRGRATAGTGDGARECSHNIILPDSNQVLLRAYSFTTSVPPCDLADQALDSAVASLQRDGIRYDPNRNAGFSLAGADACGTLDAAALGRAGIGVSAFPGFGGWTCSWGSADNYASVTFGGTTDRTGVAGEPGPPIAGHRTFVQGEPGRCTVSVAHREGAGLDDRLETVTTIVQVAGATQERTCASATDLATTAESRLPAN